MRTHTCAHARTHSTREVKLFALTHHNAHETSKRYAQHIMQTRAHTHTRTHADVDACTLGHTVDTADTLPGPGSVINCVSRLESLLPTDTPLVPSIPPYPRHTTSGFASASPRSVSLLCREHLSAAAPTQIPPQPKPNYTRTHAHTHTLTTNVSVLASHRQRRRARLKTRPSSGCARQPELVLPPGHQTLTRRRA